jgi:hypothetical protein
LGAPFQVKEVEVAVGVLQLEQLVLIRGPEDAKQITQRPGLLEELAHFESLLGVWGVVAVIYIHEFWLAVFLLPDY